MKSFRNIALALSAGVIFASCSSHKATVNCTVADAPESEVIVKLLNINRYEVLDTVKTNGAGQCSYKVEIQPQQPEFVYLFYKDTKIASLLLQSGDKVSVTADTLGNYTVSGSEESDKLKGVEESYSAFLGEVMALSSKMETYPEGSPEAKSINQKITRSYVDYYRGCLKYVISNPYSLTIVPVFFQTIGGNVPVFSQETDALYFNNACDSLETVYPDSRYVKALRQEALRRTNYLELSTRLSAADEVNFLDIEMPDVNGAKRKLSEVSAPAVIVHFWSAAEGTQKIYNQDVLKPVYDEYRGRGLEIYQVALDTDKANWARVVKEQGLDWINVCDGLGTASPVVATYNIAEYPATFLIVDGDIQSLPLSDASSLRKVLSKYL